MMATENESDAKKPDNLIIYIISGFLLGFSLTLIGELIDQDVHGLVRFSHFSDPYHYIVPTFSGIFISILAGFYSVKEASKRKAQNDLERSEKKFRSYFENCPVSVYVTNKEGYFTDVNPAAKELLDYDSDEFLNKTIDDILISQISESPNSSNKNVFKTGQISLETELRKKNGLKVYSLLNAVKLSDNQVLGFITDLTQIKEAEASLRESENIFRFVAEHPYLSISIYQDGKFIFRNKTAEELTGYSTEEIDAMGPDFIANTVHPDFVQFLTEQIGKKSKADPSAMQEYIYKIICKNGEVKWVRSNSFTLQYKNRNAIIVVRYDITTQKESERQLKESNKRIDRLKRMETVFRLGSTLAHDINNILTILEGNSSLSRSKLGKLLENNEILQQKTSELVIDREEVEKILSEDQRVLNRVLKFQKEISNAVERGARHTNRLLRTTKRSNLEIKIYRIRDLLQLIDEVISFSFRSDSPIGIAKNYSNLSVNVEFDFDVVANAIFNLIINSIDAIEDKGIIEVNVDEYNSTENDKSYLCISIKDSGNGISEENKNKIFEPFFTTKSNGFGIGLSSSYDQILEMGGLMDFTSRSNKGSIFNIYLPITPQRPYTDLHQDTEHYSGTILVVDDEEQIRLLMKQNLEDRGFNVITAENGILAYEIVENEWEKITGILTDINMPIMKGTELYEKVIDKYPQMKFVIMTGYFDEIINNDQFQNISIIKKPILENELIRICNELQQS